MQALPSLRLCGLLEYLNLSGLDLGRAYNPGLASDSSRQSNLEAKQCIQGKHTRMSGGKPSVAETLGALPTDASVTYLQHPSLPTAQLNK